ncbi:molybdenum cofactor guanylyltransferase [Aquimarina sp. MMG016]|uniref:molybdenum cofactor guanylyltransferase n=1 Tax=Aquimarina sp. MMG016 TaxID=2822690 RepID=UPI001B3A46DA|nr:molybdenum cofactor guanylyltransferase [Aquimarina sp. MMG016]MBQ4821053.1 molybdenum cofactor guanylyltransferase [Aquimarina sp. MMG016]
MNISKNKHITGIILAGGKSSRMGQDKGLKLHQNKPFMQHIIDALSSITKNILIVTSQKEYQKFGYPCFSDIIPDQGPVGGIYTGLSHSETKNNIVLSCDIPFITAEVLVNLINQYDANYDVTTYESTPLVTMYHRSVIKQFLNSIEEKRLSLRKTLSLLKVKHIPIETHLMPFIQNINTHQQYKEAIQWS